MKETKGQVRARHWVIRLSGVLGALISAYILIEPLLFPESIFCATLSWLGCGLAEALLKMPWLQPLNAALGLVAFVYFIYCGCRYKIWIVLDNKKGGKSFLSL